MKAKQNKKSRHQKLFFWLFLIQVSCLLTATLIFTLFLLPNNFKQTHLKFQECLKNNSDLSATERNLVCPKPYQK